MKNLIIYDETGKIFSITPEPYQLPAGIRYYLEVEVPEGKKVVSIDVTKVPHVAVMENIPLTELELTKEQINKLLPLLLNTDIRQSKAIKNLEDTIFLLQTKCKQMELEITNLKGGVI